MNDGELDYQVQVLSRCAFVLWIKPRRTLLPKAKIQDVV